ncbi:MAG: hypothetical protein IKW57_02260 [Alphaproteobacteria bacterium]|nr:hypothetical protein [Alphaproteobacteria bacterium]
MKKLITCLIALFFVLSANADDGAQPRVSIFSTSTDWQAVTGLTLNQYTGRFVGDRKLVGRGLVLYYLDGFPCYGLGYGVRVWVSPDGKTDNDLQIACVAAPTTINFAYRNATRDADQATTTGILTCPVKSRGRDLTIDLSDCMVGPDWDKYNRDL